MRRSVLALVACVALSAAGYHIHLVSSNPGAGDTVTTPLTHLELTFSGTVNPRLSSMSILSPDSSEVARVPVKGGKESTSLRGTLPRRLPAGRYIMRWRTAGDDGHAIRGAHSFTISPDK